jgi:capsular polysaccharide biosynthesis protein
MVASRSTAVALAVVATIASCSSKSGPRTYHAEAELLVVTSGGDGSRTAADTVANLATGPDVLRGVQRDLQVSLSVDQLRSKITATVVDGRHIDIVASDTDARRSAEIANSDANELRKVAPAVVTGVQISIIRPAAIPSAPTK